ncbi:MAG: tandem-95 repeat protein, partial [Myxococcota bacterium]|nr:tandem-95 repeat protein [Myxococcota bacterium]
VDGDLTIERLSRLDGAELRVAGDVTTLDASVGGTSTVVLDGTGDQALGAGGAGGTGELHDLRIEKPGGTVVVHDHVQISGDLHHVSGEVDATGATVEFQGDGNRIDAVGVAFGNVILDGYRFTLASDLDVDGDLSVERLSRLEGGSVVVAGDVALHDATIGGTGRIIQLESVEATAGDPVTTGDVLAKVTDLSGDELSIESFTQPAHGSVVHNGDGTFTYTAEPGYAGHDSFTYTVTDEHGNSDVVTASIEVEPPPLSDAELLAMTPREIAALPDAVAADLTPAQIEQLDSRQSLAVARAHADVFDAGQLNAIGHGRFGWVDPAHLGAETFAGIEAEQLNTMREAQFGQLSSEQLATLTPERIESLDSHRSLYLARQNAGDLDADQLNAIGHGRFRHVDVTELSVEQFAGIDAGQLDTMRESQFAKLSAEQLATLTPERIESLDAHRSLYLARQNAGDLDVDQLNAIGHDRFRYVDVTQLSAEQFAGIDADQLNTMRQSQFEALSPEQVATLTPERIESLDSHRSLYLARQNAADLDADQLNAIGHGRFGYVDVTQLSAEQFAGLDAEQLNTMRETQFSKLSGSQLGTLSPERIEDLDSRRSLFLARQNAGQLDVDQLNAIGHGRFGHVDVTELSAAQFSGIDADQLNTMREGQFKALTPEQLATLTPERIEGLDSYRSLFLARQNAGDLDADQLNAIGHGRFRHVDMTDLSPEQFAGLDADQLNSMRQNQFGQLSEEQLATLTPERIEDLDSRRSLYLARQNAADLDADQLNAIGHGRFGHVDVTQLSAEQFASLDGDTLNAMRQSQFKSLSPEQLETLTPERIEELDSRRSLYLARHNAGELDVDQLNAIGHGRFRHVDMTELSVDHFAGIEGDQLNTMRRGQFADLSPEQVATLTPERILELDRYRLRFLLQTQGDHLSPEQLAAIHHGRFGSHVQAAPFVDAGSVEAVDEGDHVTLLAQAADPNDDTLRIEWVQTRGPAVEMIAADTLEPSFIAPEGLVNTDLAFELRVSDGRATSVDDVHVTVRADDDAPEAFAGGDQAVAAGETVTLVGSGSDPEGQQLRYEWVQTAGPPVEIEDPTASTLVIEAPRGGDPSELAFELRVSDGVNHSIDTVVVAVDAEPALPFQPPPDPRPESELARGDVDADEAEDAYAGMEILHETGRVVPTVELEADARGVSEVVQQVIAADTLQTVGGESPLELELDDLTAPSGPRQPVSVDSDRPFAAVFSEGPLALTPDPPSTTEPDSVAEPGLDPPEAPAEGGSFMAAFWSLLRIGGPARGREAGDEQDAKRRHL